MKTNIIAAVCNNRGIGKSGSIPWYSKEDLQFFSRMTRGNGENAVVMGRNTWNSIGKRSLPKRFNIVLTRTGIEGDAHVCSTLEEVDSVCLQKNISTLWVIGGEQVYKEYLRREKINECYITRIDGDYDCDTFFPELRKGRTPTSLKIDNLTVEYYSML